MILLQVVEASETLLKASKEQGYIVFLLSFLLIISGFLAWKLFLIIEEKNKNIQAIYQEQIRMQSNLEKINSQIHDLLMDLNKAYRQKNENDQKNLIAELSLLLRNTKLHE